MTIRHSADGTTLIPSHKTRRLCVQLTAIAVTLYKPALKQESAAADEEDKDGIDDEGYESFDSRSCVDAWGWPGSQEEGRYTDHRCNG